MIISINSTYKYNTKETKNKQTVAKIIISFQTKNKRKMNITQKEPMAAWTNQKTYEPIDQLMYKCVNGISLHKIIIVTSPLTL